MIKRFRMALPCVLLAAGAGAAAQTTPFDDPLPQGATLAKAGAAGMPAHWTLSSAELPAGACPAGTEAAGNLCRAEGRVAPPDDAVFQFAVQQAAAADALPAVAAVPVAPVAPDGAGARKAGGPVQAGIGSVPEPQAYALLCCGLGLFAAGLARRRGRRADGYDYAAGARPNEAR